MSEASYKRRVLAILDDHFEIREEVNGKHFSGKELKIDAIAIPRITSEWKNDNIALGIEFKDELRLHGDTTNYTKWFAQCVDYANTLWNSYGYIYVFACPGLIEGIPATATVGKIGWLLPRLMSHLGIGELRFDGRHGLTFFLQQSHRIWSQLNGVESGRFWNMERKFGTR